MQEENGAKQEKNGIWQRKSHPGGPLFRGYDVLSAGCTTFRVIIINGAIYRKYQEW